MSMKPVEITYSPRGFEVYGDDIPTAYGHRVSLYESSAASGPHCWLNVNREGRPAYGRDEDATAHLSLEQAEELQSRLAAFIVSARKRWEL